ncbi:VOC family protein [Pyxidicoccus fallax]|uniref:VOC family protein n=1 Tax=Pyxidicoccus fallax TaxID=394095 RepID=A0A848LFM1_9BACT|nr:VOC family protein [Pyxidicoccus fallax]NMO14388.1 VOC family protein [Pyxidicoccus fallax]NPC78766.1 VOC family protein [Pyxidicoccus fallax]
MTEPLFKRVDTVFIPVRDLKDAIGWYTWALGFTLRWQSGNYAALNAGETAVTLHQPEGEHRPFGDHAPLNFYASDIEAAHRKLKEAGATVESIQTMPGIRFFDFKDPDGNRLGVCWFPEK